MTHRHPSDPPAQHDAAERLGIIMADGLLSEEDAGKTMAVIVKVAFDKAPNVDRRGLRARLVWSARDSRKARELQRTNAETSIRWAVRPLFHAKAPAEDIQDAAKKANGGILSPADVNAILRDEMQRAIQKARG